LLVHPGLKDLINEHQIYFADWLQPGHDISLLSKEGYKQFRAQKLDGNPGFVWLPGNRVFGNFIENQSYNRSLCNSAAVSGMVYTARHTYCPVKYQISGWRA